MSLADEMHGPQGGVANAPTPDEARALVIERHRRMASNLSGSARRLRFSADSRRALYGQAGLRPRPRDRAFRALSALANLLVFLTPAAAGVWYFGFYASDIYVSETRFTVRTSAPAMPKGNGGMKEVAIPAAKIVQDTQIVTNNTSSRAMLEDLQESLDLRAMYAGEGIDWFARLSADATREEFEEYWRDMSDASISLPGGIVTLEAQAFSAADAQAITREMLARSEALINDLNDRIWRDVSVTAQANLEEAAERLATARIALREEQNTRGVLDVGDEAESRQSLLAEVRGELLELKSRYEVRARSLNEDAPQQRVLAREIAAKEAQVEALQAETASTAPQGEGDTLADVAEAASQLEFDKTLAEETFADAVKLVEQLRLLSSQQLMYLDPFLAPTLPQEAERPRRILLSLLSVIAALVAWMVVSAVLQVMRRKFD